MNGLNDFSVEDGIKEVKLPAILTPQTLTDMKFKDSSPVIINEHMAELTEAGSSIFFGDLKRVLMVGERKALSLQKSTEYVFIRDENDRLIGQLM